MHAVVAGAGSIAGFTTEQVEEVRMVVRMLPIFFTTIFYWTIYSQVCSSPLQSFDYDTVLNRLCRSYPH